MLASDAEYTGMLLRLRAFKLGITKWWEARFRSKETACIDWVYFHQSQRVWLGTLRVATRQFKTPLNNAEN